MFRKNSEFYLDSIEILGLKTTSQVAHLIVDHHYWLYSFSHFIPKYVCTKFLNHNNEEIGLWHEIVWHINYRYLHQINKEDMVTSVTSSYV
jgi:hypothetical protein